MQKSCQTVCDRGFECVHDFCSPWELFPAVHRQPAGGTCPLLLMASREKGYGAETCRRPDPPFAPHETIFNKESLQKVNCRLLGSIQAQIMQQKAAKRYTCYGRR